MRGAQSSKNPFRAVALGLLALLGLALLVGLALPRRWRVEREAFFTGARAYQEVHQRLDDLRRWQEWSVWTKDLDPLVRHTYEGPEEGRGAKWSWLGPVMGRGQLEIVESDLRKGLTLAATIEGTEVNGEVRIVYARTDHGVKVTWTDEGTLPPIIGGYLVGTVEARLGRAVERSLSNLQAQLAAEPKPLPP